MSNLLSKVFFRTEIADAKVTDEHRQIIVDFAEKNSLNIEDKHLTGFLDKLGNVSVVVKYDGWIHLLNKTETFDGMEFKYSDSKSIVPATIKSVYDWIDCVIYRKDREHPIVVREHFSDLYSTDHDYWEKPNRVLRQIALAECARVAFGISGIRDEYSLPSLDSVTSRKGNPIPANFEKPVRIIDTAAPAVNNVVSIMEATTTSSPQEISISAEEREPIDLFIRNLTQHPAAFSTPKTIIDQLGTRYSGHSLQYAVQEYEKALNEFNKKSSAQQ